MQRLRTDQQLALVLWFSEIKLASVASLKLFRQASELGWEFRQMWNHDCHLGLCGAGVLSPALAISAFVELDASATKVKMRRVLDLPHLFFFVFFTYNLVNLILIFCFNP